MKKLIKTTLVATTIALLPISLIAEAVPTRQEVIYEDIFIPTIEEYTTETDLREPCGLTAEQLDKGLLHNLVGYGEDFLEAEKEYKVNAVALASIAAHEGAWGKSNASINKNNFFGWGPGIYFETPKDGIFTVAESLYKNYLDPDGKWYNGSNLKGVNVIYCSTGPEPGEWKNMVVDTMNSIMGRILD